MNFLEQLRQKPRAKKIKIIWTISLITAVLLLILWIYTSKIGKTGPKDMTLFETLKKGIRGIKENYKR